MSNNNTPRSLGYLVIWRMADVAAPYSDLEKLAQDAGFDPAYVPAPPSPKNAWEKSTNLKNVKLAAPQDLINRVQRQYNCEPHIKAETKIIDANVRHIVRSLVIQNAAKKEEQLDMASVAIIKFDPDKSTDVDKFVALYHPDFDPKGAVDGNIDKLIQSMMAEYARQLTMADGQDVRYKVREFLTSLNAACLADGTYFVPDSVPGAADKLAGFQNYVLGLGRYKETNSTLTCQVYRVFDDNTAFAERNIGEIKAGVVAGLKGTLAGLLKAFTEKDGRGQQATTKRIEAATVEFLQVKDSIKLYKESLADNLQALDDMLKMVQNSMLPGRYA